MESVFKLNHEKIGDCPLQSEISALDALSPINSRESFNHYCQEACRLWREKLPEGTGEASPYFTELLSHIAQGGDDVIQTNWGGVVITRHEHPHVEKYLIVHRNCYLALEKHEMKDERLEVKEGAGLILWRQPNEQRLTVESLRPGSEFHLAPGQEHCLIGTENLLVFERSIDPKGMDKDLIFIYEPDAIEKAAEQS